MKKIVWLVGMIILGIAQNNHATLQNNTAYIDEIQLSNTTRDSIVVHTSPSDKIVVPKGQIKNILLDHAYNFFILNTPSGKYCIEYQNYDIEQPIVESHCQDRLDVATIAWIAQNNSAFDQINIQNDMLYKIAIMWAWNKTRSKAQIIEPNETVSHIVREEQPTKSGVSQGQVALSLIDANTKKCSVSFKRRVLTPKDAESDNSWHEITLSANTLMAFCDGTYKVAQ